MASPSTPIINGEHHAVNPTLKLIIVGAGIGGLTAAIALRQQGHEIHVGESGSLAYCCDTDELSDL